MTIDQNDLAIISQLIQQNLQAQAPGLAQRDFGPMFDKYKITYGTDLEFIADTLYDTNTYPAAGSLLLTFFGTQRATVDLSNLSLGNMLPDRQGFLVMSIRVWPASVPQARARGAAATTQAGAINDMMQIITTGVLNLNFLNKDYGKFPLWLLPAGAGVWGIQAAEGATADPGAISDFANNGIPDARNIYVLEQPLFLPPMTKLGVTATWPALAAIQGNTPLKVLFDGLMVRPVQ